MSSHQYTKSLSNKAFAVLCCSGRAIKHLYIIGIVFNQIDIGNKVLESLKSTSNSKDPTRIVAQEMVNSSIVAFICVPIFFFASMLLFFICVSLKRAHDSPRRSGINRPTIHPQQSTPLRPSLPPSYPVALLDSSAAHVYIISHHATEPAPYKVDDDGLPTYEQSVESVDF